MGPDVLQFEKGIPVSADAKDCASRLAAVSF
jgi:hypothetical protein